MSLSFTNTAGNLFNRLGRFGKLAHVGRTFQGDLVTYFNALLAQYDSSVASPLQAAVDGVPGVRDSVVAGAVSAYMDSIRANAEKTVLEMVKADKPTSANSLADALYEVYLQMGAAAATIKKCTVTASVAAGSGNSGDGSFVVTAKRGDGRDQELIIPEVSYIRCTADSQEGGATEGQEAFQYVGEVGTSGVWANDFPIGSGQSATYTLYDARVDPSAGQTTGNLLTNGDMESFTANLPAGWTALVGTAGVDFQENSSASHVYGGAKSLRINGGGANVSLAQTFNDSSGTLGVLLPSSGYAIHFRAKVDVVPASGVLTIDLVDSTNTTINDDQGVANSFTVAITGLTTSFTAQTGSFRLPKLVPSVVKLRVRISTALSAGTILYLDHFGLGRHNATYNGGPGVAGFSGATKFVANDYFSLTTTNDFGGASNLSTFHWLLDRLFRFRDLGILFPTNAAPTVADTLITS